MDYRDGLLEMPPYDGPEREWRIKVNANEFPLNLPPLVAERVMGRLASVAFNRYPSDEEESLAEAIAKSFSLEKNQVFIGNGSSEIIEKLFFAFGGANHRIVYPFPSFSMYGIYVKAAEAEGIPVPLEAGFRLDPEKFVSAVKKSRASLAVVCNPNNPTGNLMTPDEIVFIAENTDCAFLVDEAYIEFAEGFSAAGLIKKYPRVMIARTFSKAYGLAAARVGYLLADEGIISALGKAFMPYHMNVLSLVTADIVYQMRDEFTPRIHMTISERKRMSERLSKLPGVEVLPSHTNFLLIGCDEAQGLSSRLAERGIGVRDFGATELSRYIRISMGTREENDEILRAAEEFLG